MVEAAKAQLDKLVHCCSYIYHQQPLAELAEKLAHITPGKLRKTFFANSGAEAIEGALRLARQYTGKYEFIALTHSFHGRTNATLSLTGNAGRKKGGGPYLPGIAFAPAPYPYRCPFRQKDPAMSAKYCAQTPVFAAAADIVEEAVLNSVFKAVTVVGRDANRAEALDIDKAMEVLNKYRQGSQN